ncbi:hypothetical protein DMENIID0001_116550 [Sergentomyia squamirostris]
MCCAANWCPPLAVGCQNRSQRTSDQLLVAENTPTPSLPHEIVISVQLDDFIGQIAPTLSQKSTSAMNHHRHLESETIQSTPRDHQRRFY